MSARQSGWGLALLWLCGCTATGPTSPDLVQKQKQAKEQEQVQMQAQLLAQAKMQASLQAHVEEPTLTASRMLAGLERVATLEPKIAKQMIDDAQTGSAEATLGDRFELVLLLSKKGADDKSLKRAILLLDGLESHAKEPGVLEILRMQRRYLLLEQQYRSERRKTAELQTKIEHLKGLEQELEESNRRMEAPLSPKPEPAQ